MAGDQIEMQTCRYITGVFTKGCHESSNHFPGMISTYFIISEHIFLLSCHFCHFVKNGLLMLFCPVSTINNDRFTVSTFTSLIGILAAPNIATRRLGQRLSLKLRNAMPAIFFRQAKADATQDIDVDV